MNEPKPVPSEIKNEATEIELDRTNDQLAESLVLIQQLMVANHMLDQNAKALAAGLIEIQNIKGNPPIQVARTIATRTINDIVEQMQNTQHEQESQDPSANGNPILCVPGDHQGTSKHEAKHIPGGTPRGGDGEQGAGL